MNAPGKPCINGHDGPWRLNKNGFRYCGECRRSSGAHPKPGVGGPRQMPQPFTCRYCGDPVRFEGGACMRKDCQAADTSERNRIRKRALAPRPLPQRDPSLPPLGMIIADHDGERIQCHVCGEFYTRLHRHVRSHGYLPETYRNAFGLNVTTPLASPAEIARLAERAERMDLGHLGDHFRPGDKRVRARRPGRPASLQTKIMRSETQRIDP